MPSSSIHWIKHGKPWKSSVFYNKENKLALRAMHHDSKAQGDVRSWGHKGIASTYTWFSHQQYRWAQLSVSGQFSPASFHFCLAKTWTVHQQLSSHLSCFLSQPDQKHEEVASCCKVLPSPLTHSATCAFPLCHTCWKIWIQSLREARSQVLPFNLLGYVQSFR